MSQQIPSATALAQKKELNLFAKAWVGNGQVAAIAESLKVNTSLTFIGFRECRTIDDVGAIAIAKALKCNSTLRKLSLESTKVGNRGVAAIADAIPQSGLSRIDLGYCLIGDEGALYLATAISNPSCQLVTLNLDYCAGITDAGAEALLIAQADNASSVLTSLGLKGTSISSAMRARLELSFGGRGGPPQAKHSSEATTRKRARSISKTT